MTAAIPYQAMSVITANAVTEIIVHSAVPIARCVTPHCVWDAPMSVPAVTSLFVRVVLANVRIAKKYFVRTA